MWRRRLACVLLAAAVLGTSAPARAEDGVAVVAQRLVDSLVTNGAGRGQWEGALRAIAQAPGEERAALYRAVFPPLLQPGKPPQGMDAETHARLGAFLIRHLLEDVPGDAVARTLDLGEIESLALKAIASDDGLAATLSSEFLVDPVSGRRAGHERLLEMASERLRVPAPEPTPENLADAAAALRVLAREGTGAGGERVIEAVAVLARRYLAPEGPRLPFAAWRAAFEQLLDTTFPNEKALQDLLQPGSTPNSVGARLATFTAWGAWSEVERVRLDRDLRAEAALQAFVRDAAPRQPPEYWEAATGWASELINGTHDPAVLKGFWGSAMQKLPRPEALQRLAAERARKLLTAPAVPTPGGNGASPAAAAPKTWAEAFAEALRHVQDAQAMDRIATVLANWRPTLTEGARDLDVVGEALVVRLREGATRDAAELRRRLMALMGSYGTLKHGQEMLAQARAAYKAAQAAAAGGAPQDDVAAKDARALYVVAIEALPQFAGVQVADLAGLLADADAPVRAAVARALRRGQFRDAKGRGPSVPLLRQLVLGPAEGEAPAAVGAQLPDPSHDVREAALRSLEAFTDSACSAALEIAVLAPPDKAEGREDEARLAVELLGRMIKVGGAPAPPAQALMRMLVSTQGHAELVRPAVVAALQSAQAELPADLVPALAEALVACLADAGPDVVGVDDEAGNLAVRLGTLPLAAALVERVRRAAGDAAAAETWTERAEAAYVAFAEATAALPIADRPARDALLAAELERLGAQDAGRALRVLRAVGVRRSERTWVLTATLARRLARDPAAPLEARRELLDRAIAAEAKVDSGPRRAEARADLRLEAAGLEREAGQPMGEAAHLRAALAEALVANKTEPALRVHMQMARLLELLQPDEKVALEADLERLRRLAEPDGG
jgi:hypothetical protein